MKHKVFQAGGLTLVLLLAAAFTIKSPGEEEIKTLEIGEKAPQAERKMMDISGSEFSLNTLKMKNGLLVIFSCNSCPFVVGNESSEGWEGRYNSLSKIASENQIGMVLVNANEAKRGGDDSFEAMKKRAMDNKYLSKYVVDSNHQLADAFGARTTPHVFLFDQDMKLVYKGAIDDNVKSSKNVKQPYLHDAITNLVKGKKINPNSTRQTGCSIKRLAN